MKSILLKISYLGIKVATKLKTLKHKRYISREETNFQRGGVVKKVKT